MKEFKPLPLPKKSYPFRKMEPGDFEYMEFVNLKDLQRAQNAAQRASEKNGYRFITRKTGLGLNVWCTEKDSDYWD